MGVKIEKKTHHSKIVHLLLLLYNYYIIKHDKIKCIS